MGDIVLVVVIALQWFVVLYQLVTHRIEVKRLVTDLKEALEGQVYAAGRQQAVTVPPETIQVPHPNRPGDEVTLYHLGAGAYGPEDPDKILSGVEEVEGAM